MSFLDQLPEGLEEPRESYYYTLSLDYLDLIFNLFLKYGNLKGGQIGTAFFPDIERKLIKIVLSNHSSEALVESVTKIEGIKEITKDNFFSMF